MSTDPRKTDADSSAAGQAPTDANEISPLAGEPGIPDVAAPQRTPVSKKALLALGLFIVTLVISAALGLQRVALMLKKPDAQDRQAMSERPAAATAEARKLDMAPAASPPSGAAPAPRIPALVPTEEEMAEPIGVRRTRAGAPAGTGAKAPRPEDAPVLLVSTRPGQGPGVRLDEGPPSAGTSAEALAGDRKAEGLDPMAATTRNLEGYQRQLQGLLGTLTRSAALAAGGSDGAGSTSSLSAMSAALPVGFGPATPSTPSTLLTPPTPATPPATGLFGGQLQGASTPRAAATLAGNRSLTLSKGTAFTCALKTRVISATSGLVGCLVQRHVFSDDGRVLLIERGSHLDGEYRITSVRPGMVRIPVLWTRLRTPLGVTVDIESPATGPLGESGIDGHVDNRWTERIGAAMLLSLIDDSVKLVIQQQASERQSDTIVLPATTANGSKLAEKVLDSTINIPPLVYRNQGGVVGIYVARDVDFSSVYELQPSAEGPARP